MYVSKENCGPSVLCAIRARDLVCLSFTVPWSASVSALTVLFTDLVQNHLLCISEVWHIYIAVQTLPVLVQYV